MRMHATAGGGNPLLQRNGESAALLKELPEPQVLKFESDQGEVQKDIVTKLEAAITGQKTAFREKERVLESVEARANECGRMDGADRDSPLPFPAEDRSQFHKDTQGRPCSST